MIKPKLLLISGISPFPQTSGGATRIKQTLFYLSKRYNIYFYFFASSSYKLSEDEENFLDNYTAFFKSVSIQKKSILKSFETGIPYHFSSYFNEEIASELVELQKKIIFDEVRIEFSQLLYLEKYLRKISSIQFVSHDVSSISFYRRAFASKNPLKILIRLFSCLQVYFYEKSLLKSFSKVAVVSRKDAFFVKKLFNLDQVEISPNGIEKIDFLTPRNKEKLTIGFVGSIEHTPNKKALDYLLFQILPALQEKQIDFEVLVLGKNNHLFYQNLANVEFIDYIDDLRDFYAKIDLLIATIFAGSGTRLKILESLSYGRPVITTEIGAEGIEIESKLLSIVPREDQKNPQAWVQKISVNNKQELFESDLSNLKNQLSDLTWNKIFSQE